MMSTTNRQTETMHVFLFIVVQTVVFTDGQLLPPDAITTPCVLCTTTEDYTTTINPYFQCDSNEYYVQGQCKNYTDTFCNNKKNIATAILNCNTSDTELFGIFIQATEYLCNYYLSLDTCITDWMQRQELTCTAAETRFVLNAYIEAIVKSIGMPPLHLYNYETCTVYTAGFTLRLVNATWSSMYSNVRSQYFWMSRDKHDQLGSVLIDVTVFWTMNTTFTVTEITDMIRDGIDRNSTYKLHYEFVSVNLNEGLTCSLGGIAYAAGESFRTDDLCNRCVCNNGSLYCTAMNCSATVWLDEYCSVTSDCESHDAVCTDNKCVCGENYFPIISNFTKYCGKRGLNETCSSNKDCDGKTIVCEEGYCSCLLGCFNANNECIICVSDDGDSSIVSILIVVFSVIAVFILATLLVVVVYRVLIRKKVIHKGRKSRRLSDQELEDVYSLPTALHVKPFVYDTFYNARLAKPYMMGDFPELEATC